MAAKKKPAKARPISKKSSTTKKTAKKKAAKKITGKKKVSRKKAARKPVVATVKGKKKPPARVTVPKKQIRRPTPTPSPSYSREDQRASAAGQSGDLQGLSWSEQADSQSVDELVEEGNAFEADVVSGVEAADREEGREVHTREVPEDDVPEEYLDEE